MEWLPNCKNVSLYSTSCKTIDIRTTINSNKKGNYFSIYSELKLKGTICIQGLRLKICIQNADKIKHLKISNLLKAHSSNLNEDHVFKYSILSMSVHIEELQSPQDISSTLITTKTIVELQNHYFYKPSFEVSSFKPACPITNSARACHRTENRITLNLEKFIQIISYKATSVIIFTNLLLHNDKVNLQYFLA